MSLLSIETLENVDIETIKSKFNNEQEFSDSDEVDEDYLVNDDMIRAKCGEILVSKNGVFTVLCIFCDEKFSSFSTFASHIHEIHLELDNNEKKEKDFIDTVDILFKSESSENEHSVKGKNKTEDLENSEVNRSNLQTISIAPMSFTLNDCRNKLESNDGDDELPEIDFFDISPAKSEKKYTCDICEEELLSYKELFEHKLRHKLKSLSCETCGKLFQKEYQLRRHMIMHSEEGTFKCDLCDSVFKCFVYLKIHMRIHMNEKKHECDYCGKRFIRNVELRTHMRCHTGEKPYQCEICGRNYRTTASLNDHKKRHSDIKPFSCDKCGRSYHSKRLLTRHAVAHSDLRPYSCDICGATFSRRKSLKTHEKIHLPFKEYVCLICDKPFAQYAGLYAHMKTHGVLSSTKTMVEEVSVTVTLENS